MDDDETKKFHEITENECDIFLQSCLTRDNFFGGTESLKAVALMHEVNIIIFNESGPVYFALGFNPNYHKSILLAYRLDATSSNLRNHYDSVAEVGLDLLYNCVQSLLDKESKKDELNKQSIIEI